MDLGKKFVFYQSWLDVVNCYDDHEKQLEILRAIIEIGLNPDIAVESFSTSIRPALILIKESMQLMQRSYDQKKMAGVKGMQKRWNKDEDEYNKYLKLWNGIDGVPLCTKITSDRMILIKNFEKEYTFDDFSKSVEIIKKSDFLLGKNNLGFKATFDWILLSKNFNKVIEGNYSENNNKPNKINEIWDRENNLTK